MEFRKATPEDLPQLIGLYTAIYLNMQEQGIYLWNERYPADALPGDISAGRLHVLIGRGKIVAAFALDEDTPFADVQWSDPYEKAAILMRLGVQPESSGLGFGRRCLKYAAQTARDSGFKYLRVLVVDCNTPAERFYQKCGCAKAPGIHAQHVEGIDGVLKEYGYEIKL